MARRGQNRDRLLEAGMGLFTSQGFHATGVQEIADAAGVPKGSFYNYFESKEQFAAEVLDRYQQRECRSLAKHLGADLGSPVARLRAAFEAWIEDMRASGFTAGCLAGRLAQELAGEVPQLRPPLEHAFTCMRSHMTSLLTEAREVGEIDAGPPPEVLAEFILNAWQGAMQRAKAAGDESPLRVCADVVVDQLLRPHDTPTAA